MFGWLKNGIRRWLNDTTTSPASVKAARSVTLTDAIGGGIAGTGVGSPTWSDWDTRRYHIEWVYAAVRAVSQRVASQPVKVGRKVTSPSRRTLNPSKAASSNNPTSGGKVRELPDHELNAIFDSPNPFLTEFSLIQLVVASLEIAGTAFVWVDEEKDETRLWYLPSGWVREDPEADLPLTKFIVRPEHSAEEFRLDTSELIRFALPDPANPLEALSPLKAAFQSVLTDREIQSSQVATFKNGGRPGLLVKIGQTADASGIGSPDDAPSLTQGQRRVLAQRIKEATSGSLNSGEPIILDALIREVTKITNTPAEMDFTSSGAITRDRILMAFGVNPIILGWTENANRASATVADEHFCFATCEPLCRLVSDHLTAWFRVYYRDDSLVVWIDPPRPRDPDGRRADLDQLIRAGAIKVNELRAEHGLSEDPDGNVWVKAPTQPTPTKPLTEPTGSTGTEKNTPLLPHRPEFVPVAGQVATIRKELADGTTPLSDLARRYNMPEEDILCLAAAG